LKPVPRAKVWALSLAQGPVSVAPCQALIVTIRKTLPSLYVERFTAARCW
jgi:hypothetical protein